MSKLVFQDLSFEEKENKIIVTFLKIFTAEIGKEDLSQLGDFKIKENSIEFQETSETKANRKFNQILAKAFQNLTNKITKKKTIYIHQNSNIPLIGNNAFGIIDRDTNILELRIITGCNLNCIYCSVDQDQRPVDFVVEKDYLINEIKRLITKKKVNNIECHIGTQGEPLFYAPLEDLIKDLSKIKEIKRIALDTNGTLLTEKKVDELISAGLTRFCFSINAVDKDLAKEIAGTEYNPKHILKILKHISKKKVELILTPVWIPTINDKEIPKLIELSKELKCNIGIQNFLNYQFGKNPVKQMPWEEFINKMKLLEKEHNVHLLFDFKKDFDIVQTSRLEKPFKKGNIIKARIVCPGRLKNSMIAAENNRNITIPSCKMPVNTAIKLRITRSKHNIFFGVII